MTRRWLVILCVAAMGCGDDGSSTTPHALIIGIDGVRSDALEAASTPALDALILDGTYSPDAFAGGELGSRTEQRTLSGPGWSSILTGVWADKHGVELNVVVSDHGGLRNLHGGQSTEERTIPLIISGGEWRRGATLSPGPGQVVVPPAVLQHLRIAIDPDWGWESGPPHP